MKQLFLFSVLWLASIRCNAQFSLGLGAGASTKKSPIIELQVSHQTGIGLFLSGGYQVHLSNDIDKPAILQARAGYQLPLGSVASFIPSAGYAFHLHSTDIKALNRHTWLVSVQFERLMRSERGLTFLNLTYSNQIFTSTIGIKGIIQ